VPAVGPLRALLWVLVSVALGVGAAAAEEGVAPGAVPVSASANEGMRPNVPMVRVEQPPSIDGSLDDAVWQQAPVLERFLQIGPRPGDPPSEATEIRLLFDADFLYVGIRCWDREPDRIIARQMIYDVELTTDDRVSMVLDPFDDQQNGYLFSVNPLGTRWDGLIEPGPEFRQEWDGIWYADAQIDAEGWTAEVAIPFKTISFNPATDTWGFNVMRAIRRRNEVVRWASPTPDLNFIDLGGAGRLVGMRGMEQGLGLDVKPTMALAYIDDQVKEDVDRKGHPALDLFYKVTPALTGSLTFNTDFSEAPVDEREVNLTRFPLFFPETRDFFLQDAGIFEFAGIEKNGRPFFSRRIGLRPSGEPVDIRAGGKLTGRVGRVGVGLLDIQQDSFEDVDSQNLGVARLTYDLFEESFIGAIATRGDPDSNENNGVVGVDLRLRTSNFRNQERALAADAWFLHSYSEGASSDETSFGARVDYPNDRINFAVEFQEIQENFRPALGFVKRENIRRYEGHFRYRARPQGRIAIVDSEIRGLAVTDTESDFESGEIAWDPLRVESELGDIVKLTYRRVREDLDEDFEISDGVILPPGRYGWNRFELALETTPARPVSLDAMLGWGDFFDGTRLQSEVTLEWRPSRHLFAALEYEQNDVRLDEGNFTTRLGRLRLDLMFTTALSWTTLAQYDSVSDIFGINSRLFWEVEPGNEIFLILNQEYEADHDHFRSRRTETILKAVYTFRF
jgi:hypothetical protein